MKSSLCLLQLEKACLQQQRPSAAKKKLLQELNHNTSFTRGLFVFGLWQQTNYTIVLERFYQNCLETFSRSCAETPPKKWKFLRSSSRSLSAVCKLIIGMWDLVP
ncbi:unnamed protein product [Rangifer tarandus platyrhynchus]|uniref:Uncharacterized protein n=2 Tax=Rangifer tarandus platyrhynchus TaxID=3082113 RepID=A0AC59ZM87_RANTA|nr:unnamed protein product [Rangifer tarandus platyrhynchus]